MKINDELIVYLQQLSRLSLTPEEMAQAEVDMQKIVDHIDSLSELDTDGVDEMSHSFDYSNKFRDDEVLESYDRELILKNAPEQKDGCFKVAKTVD